MSETYHARRLFQALDCVARDFAKLQGITLDEGREIVKSAGSLREARRWYELCTLGVMTLEVGVITRPPIEDEDAR